MIPDAYFDRFATAKSRAKNPLQRALIRRFVARLHDLFLEAQPARSMLEVGVGEGFLSGYLSEQLPEKRFHGVDLREEDIARLRELFPRIDGRVGSAYDLSAFTPGEIDLVLCAEVLEHLDNLGPLEAWRTIAGWLEDGYEASVPAHALDDVLEHLDELHAATEKATGEMAALRGAVVLADPVAVFGRLMLADPQKWLRRFETDAEEAKPPTPEDVLQVERFIRAAEALEAAKPAVT